MFGPKLHWYLAKHNNFPLDFNVKTKLPLVSYNLTGMSHDPERQLNQSLKIESPSELSSFVETWCMQAVPYNFTFDLSLWCKNISDINQFTEQLVSMFHPSHNLHVHEIPLFGVWRTCRLILNSVTSNNTTEWELKGDRVLKTNFSFTLEGNIYPRIQELKLLQYIHINYKIDQFPDDILTDVLLNSPAVTTTENS